MIYHLGRVGGPARVFTPVFTTHLFVFPTHVRKTRTLVSCILPCSTIVENSRRGLAMRTEQHRPATRPETLKGSPPRAPIFLPQIQACTHTVLRRWTTVCALGHRQLHAGSHTTRESSVSPALPAARHRRHRRRPAPGRAHGPAIGPPPHKPSPSAPPPAQQLLPPL